MILLKKLSGEKSMTTVNVKYTFYIEPSEYPQEYAALMGELAYDNEIYELFPCSEYYIEEVIEKIPIDLCTQDLLTLIILTGETIGYRVLADYNLTEVKWRYTVLDFTTPNGR